MVFETVICRAKERPFDPKVYPCLSVRSGHFQRPVADLQCGVTVLTSFMDALGFGRLCGDRLGQLVPSGAASLRQTTRIPGRGARCRRRTCLGAVHPAFLFRGLWSAARERFAPFVAPGDYGAGNGSGKILDAVCGPAALGDTLMIER